MSRSEHAGNSQGSVEGRQRRRWERPTLVELPRLTELTLQTEIPGACDCPGAGSVVIP